MEAILTGSISTLVGYFGFQWNVFKSIRLFDNKDAPLSTLYGLFMTGFVSALLSMIMTNQSIFQICFGSIFMGIITMIIGLILFVLNALLHTQILGNHDNWFEVTLLIAFFFMGFLSHLLYLPVGSLLKN
jgi:hypothetical protein